MTEKQRIGQLIMIGVPADDLATGLSQVGSSPVGGIFLAGKFTGTADDIAAGVGALQAAATKTSGVKLQVAVDQEGGYVQSLRGPDFPAIPAAVDQGQESSATLSADTAQWSTALVNAGITLDLAPVADTVPAGTASENPPIGQQDRQYGSTPDAVSDAVVPVVTAMRKAGLGATVKHFPGLGRVRVNTDTSADATDDQTTTTDEALQPFIDAITAGATAVMISSARYPRLDPDHIAAFSAPIVTDLLRKKLGFDRLVISDDLGAAAAVSDVGVGERAVDFVLAGGDMTLTVRASDLAPMAAALASKAAQSRSFRAMVDNAALHVLQSKAALQLLCR